MAKRLDEYKSYLLRLWRSGDGRSPWRASLEDSQDGGRHGFATLEHMFAFLAEQADEQPSIPSFPGDATATSDSEEYP
jgi:hypothetical protein